jgi:predicted NUDIX family phosphoesterase
MEFVYVVEGRFLQSLRTGYATFAGVKDIILSNGFFAERRFVEDKPEFQQIIPYTLLYYNDYLFEYRRLARGTETRLCGKRSIGIGGHINPEDIMNGWDSVLPICAIRELYEELYIDANLISLDAVGTVNDDSSEVSLVHFGVVMAARVSSRLVRIKETDTMEGSFKKLKDIKRECAEHPDEFEDWSRLILEE